jgi:hypothetical protein
MIASFEASFKTSRCRRAPAPAQAPLASLGAAAAAVATVAALMLISAPAHAQQSNPGDIVLMRAVEPRIAYDSVPKDQQPVIARATTFPANSFNPAMAQLVSDTDLTNARGSSGVATNGVLVNSGMQAVTQILSGSATGNNMALKSSGVGAPVAGIGNTVSTTVTGALAPLGGALSGALGGLK